jgi:hypothetical protein
VTIRFQCSSCQFALSAPDEKGGAAVKCPKCKAPVVIPLAAALDDAIEVLPADPVARPIAPPVAPLAGSAAGLPGGDDVARLVARGSYANCPFCGCPGWADKVVYTWWGGFVGPAIFSLVKCRGCRASYNGKTGQPTTNAMVIYIVVSLVVVFLLLGCLGFLMFLA